MAISFASLPSYGFFLPSVTENDPFFLGYRSWGHEAPHDCFRFTPYGLKYIFEQAGFSEISVEPQSGFFTMWILKFNYFSSRLIRGPQVIRWGLKVFLVPLWFLGQLCAPWLDKFDRHWAKETIGYFVTAKKD